MGHQLGMAFNMKKYKVMHIGSKNPKHQYSMDSQQLEVTEEERDIGAIMQNNLKPSAQCNKVARTAKAVLGQISWAFHYRDRHVFVPLYTQYVHLHLEFSTQGRAPWTEGDKLVLEQVQKKAVGMVSGLAGRQYKERLLKLGLLTLEDHRHQADMCLMHKIMHSIGVLDHTVCFEKASESVRVTTVAAGES